MTPDDVKREKCGVEHSYFPAKARKFISSPRRPAATYLYTHTMLYMVLVLLTSELMYVCTPSRTLRSSSDTSVLKIQQRKRKIHGIRIFFCFGPHI